MNIKYIQEQIAKAPLLRHSDYLIVSRGARSGGNQETDERHEKSLCNPSEKRRSGAGDLVSGRSSIFFPLFCASERTRATRAPEVRSADFRQERPEVRKWGVLRDGRRHERRETRMAEEEKEGASWDSCRSISRIQLSGIKKEEKEVRNVHRNFLLTFLPPATDLHDSICILAYCHLNKSSYSIRLLIYSVA